MALCADVAAHACGKAAKVKHSMVAPVNAGWTRGQEREVVRAPQFSEQSMSYIVHM